jgi:adenylate kinase
MRARPNLLVTGTPGVGKSTFSEMLATRFGFVHIAVGDLIKEKHLWEEFDEERDCTIYSEQLLDDEIQSILEAHPDGGVVFDFHSADIVTTAQVDFVIVLQCESDVLWQRLAARGYAEEKVRENVEAEIFQVLLQEVTEDYPEGMIVEIVSNTLEDLEQGLVRIEQLVSPPQGE